MNANKAALHSTSKILIALGAVALILLGIILFNANTQTAQQQITVTAQTIHLASIDDCIQHRQDMSFADCIQAAAITQNKPYYCEHHPQERVCLRRVAEQTRTAAACPQDHPTCAQRVQDLTAIQEQNRDLCATAQCRDALTLVNQDAECQTSICQQARTNTCLTTQGVHSRTCLGIRSIITQELRYCDAIADDNQRLLCINTVATTSGRPSLCRGSEVQQEECRENIINPNEITRIIQPPLTDAVAIYWLLEQAYSS